MVFVADRHELRTYDPDRALELIYNGGGSDMSHRFILRGPDFYVSFTARKSAVPLEGTGPETPGPLRNILVWKVYSFGTLRDMVHEEICQMIAEALIAYKSVHGNPPEQAVEVVFL